MIGLRNAQKISEAYVKMSLKGHLLGGLECRTARERDPRNTDSTSLQARDQMGQNWKEEEAH